MANCQQEESGSGGRGRKLFLDTERACFLCLQDPSNGGDDDGCANGGIGLEEVSFWDVCRYLEIRGLGKSSSKGRGGGSTEFVVDLCGNCGFHVNKLSKWIRGLEEAQRGIVRELQEIQVVLKGCKEREHCKVQWEKIRENNPIDILIIEYLREETGKKGSEKLKDLMATKSTPATLQESQSLGKPAGVGPETVTTSGSSNLTTMSATSSTAPPPASSSTSEAQMSFSGDPNPDILSNGSSCSIMASRRTTQLNHSSINVSSSSTLNGSGREPTAAASTPNPTSMLASPLTAPLGTSALHGPEARIRTILVSKDPPSRLIGSATRASSDVDQMVGMAPSGNQMPPATVGASTVSNPSATMAPPATTSTTPMPSPSDLDSSNGTRTRPLTTKPTTTRKWCMYSEDVKIIFSRHFVPQVVKGVAQFTCLICEHICYKTSTHIRKHILKKHPEAIFTNVCNLSDLEFKKSVDRMSIELENRILKNGQSYQCDLCKTSFLDKSQCKYHFVMSHYTVLEKKLRRLQEGIRSEKDEEGDSPDVEGPETSTRTPRTSTARPTRLVNFTARGNLQNREQVIKGRVAGGILKFTRGKRKMPTLNDGGSLTKTRALVQSKEEDVGDIRGRQGGIRRSARQE